MPTPMSKAVLNWFTNQKLSELDNDSGLAVGLHLIELLASQRNIAFEEEDALAKQEVASIYLAKSNNEQAAKILEKINLENTSRQVSADEKARVWV